MLRLFVSPFRTHDKSTLDVSVSIEHLLTSIDGKEKHPYDVTRTTVAMIPCTRIINVDGTRLVNIKDANEFPFINWDATRSFQ